MNLIPALIALFACQLAGTALQILFALPVPGAVIGMLLLFVALLVRRNIPAGLQLTSLTLLRYLPLLFVPAGVGVMQQFGLLKREWLPISASLIGSIIITIAFTGLVMQFCLRRSRPADNDEGRRRG
ncbi:MAG: CidA/LrgA family protein [Alphaproteobacteria bacterium]|nr:CidA/LrgA family protein [Alphaproteobacteria bacterium]